MAVVPVSRRGTTLVELLVALVAGAVLLGALLALVRSAFEANFLLRDRAAVAASLRSAALLLDAELGDLDPRTDLLPPQGDSLVYRATRLAGAACGGTLAAPVLRAGLLRGQAVPSAGRDSALLLLPDSAAWRAVPVAGPAAAASCPDGAPGLRLSLAADTAAPAEGALVRVVTWSVLRRYASGGRSWLGTRALLNAEPVQPVLGPLGRDGFGVSLVDEGGATVAAPQAAALRVALVAEGERSGRRGGAPAVAETLVVRIPFGNRHP